MVAGVLRALAALALAIGGGAAGLARASDATPIAVENALPGDAGWRLGRPAADGQLEAYLDEPSVAPGGTVHVHARADGPHAITWALYRMGWYGGAEGRRVASGGPVAVGPEPVPAAAPGTGLVACAWPVSFTVTADPAWTSGVHLLVLTRDDGPQAYAIFVLRGDGRRGAAVVQASFATYQAYNRWGGRSAYSGFAPEISYDRPFAEGNGAGQYFRFEHDLVRWAESRGYDLVYATDLDLDRDPGLLDGQKLFLSVGHDEYWTRAMREHLEAALAAGVNAAFVGSNAVYWQIRLEPSRSDPARLRRTQVCYKALSTQDPLAGTPLVTVQFSDPQVGWPESALVGLAYAGWNDASLPGAAWVVRNAGHWLYEGTGVSDGDAIPGIVGYEIDRVAANGTTPPGLEVVARSPYPLADGSMGTQQAAIHVRPSGAFVFAAGTNELSWGLSRPGVADARVQRMMDNVFRRAGLAPSQVTAPPPPPPPDPPPPPASPPPPGPSAGGTVAAPLRSGGCASGGDGALGAIVLLAAAEAVVRGRRRRSPSARRSG